MKTIRSCHHVRTTRSLSLINRSLPSHHSTTQASNEPTNSLERRRAVLAGLILASGMSLGAAVAQAKPAVQATPPEPEPVYTKTPSGIILQELSSGSGPAPKAGDTLLIDYVLRRSNGYFIYSTVEGVSFQPRDIPIGPVAFKLGTDPEWIQGLQEIIGGMKQGGKLRALIPPSLGYQNCDVDQPQPPTYATKRQLVNHCKEPLLFEVALLRVTPA